MGMEVRLFVFIILSFLLLSLSCRGAQIYLKKPSWNIAAIVTICGTQSQYVHTGLIVDGVVISVGPTGLDIRRRQIVNAEFIELDRDIDLEKMIEKAKNIFTKFPSDFGLFKIALNRNLGTNFQVEGMSCSEFLARLLDFENPEDYIPKDFAN